MPRREPGVPRVWHGKEAFCSAVHRLTLATQPLDQIPVQESSNCVEPRENTQKRGAMTTTATEHDPQTDIERDEIQSRK